MQRGPCRSSRTKVMMQLSPEEFKQAEKFKPTNALLGKHNRPQFNMEQNTQNVGKSKASLLEQVMIGFQQNEAMQSSILGTRAA